jgi:NADH-quinone oxidoreductase subunit J
MTLPFIVFFVCAILAVVGALTLILAREPIHSALALMVLFVFVIMLLNAGVEERTDYSQLAKYAGLPLGIFLLLALAYWMFDSFIGKQIANGVGGTNASVSTRELSAQLFQKYLFPFEATSILILIAILGALVLAKKDE